ncbi:MAG: CBS domain-containing protein [Nitrospinae bacterium]|nr:CBS domain-containing protein [Nitrospinota bacterium]
MDSIESQMTTPVISIYSEATAQEAAQLMKEKGIGSLLIKGYEGYVGIVAERDLVYNVVGAGLDPSTTPLSSIMTESILSIEKSASSMDAGTLMLEYKINHLAVTENDDIVGILSIKDLVQIKENQTV